MTERIAADQVASPGQQVVVSAVQGARRTVGTVPLRLLLVEVGV